jgi:two-component system, response regulator RegA
VTGASDDTSPSVLLVDDDARFRATLCRAFQRRGWEVREASAPTDALASARIDAPEYAVVDLVMEQGDGVTLVRQLLALDAAMRIVLLTGFGSIATAIEAIRSGAVHYLSKPADVEDIIASLQHDGQSDVPPAVVPSLDRVEYEHIQRVLHSCNGNVTQAANLLGIHRRSLQRKLRKLPSAR